MSFLTAKAGSLTQSYGIPLRVSPANKDLFLGERAGCDVLESPCSFSHWVCFPSRDQMSLGDFAASLGLMHLENQLASITLAESLAELDAGGRVGLLAYLKTTGVEKLPERQKMATGLAKVQKSGGDVAAATSAMVEKDKREKPEFDKPVKDMRVLFLHGYGLSPKLLQSLGALEGLQSALHGAQIEILAGFEKIDLEHTPTAAVFSDPGNNLSDVREFSKMSGEPLHCWAQMREPSTEAGDKPAGGGPGYARESATDFGVTADRLLAHVFAGEYDLIVGFSQGGEHALAALARLSTGRYTVPAGANPRSIPTKFLLIGSEIDVVLDQYERAASPLRFSPLTDGSVMSPPLEVKLCLVAGEDDKGAGREDMEIWVETLRARGLKSVTMARWRGDHRLPPKGEAVYQTALKAVGVRV